MTEVTLHKRTTKLTERTNIRKAIAMHWVRGKWGWQYWSAHRGHPKSGQTCTQVNILAVFPLTTARDNHRCSLVSDISTSFFVRLLKKNEAALNCQKEEFQ